MRLVSKQSHYFSPHQDVPSKRVLISVDLRGTNVELFVASGVFSKSRVDQGSELLIEAAIIEPGWRVLDLGCGYGPVGVVLAKRFPACRFILADVNELAVSLARENIKKNRLDNAQAVVSDGLAKVDGSFDAVLLNPPQTAGREVCLRLFKESFDRLNKGGLLQIVARHRKGGETLSKAMESLFGDVKTIAKKSGYHVYVSQKGL